MRNLRAFRRRALDARCRRWMPGILAAVACLAMAALVACGSDDSNSSTGASSSSDTSGSSGNSGEPIKIGQLAPESGTFADFGGYARPIGDAWAKWVNDNGGINGHDVEVVTADTKSDGASSLAAVQDLDKQGVVAILSHDNASEAVYGKYLVAHNIPVLGGYGLTPTLWGKENNFFENVPPVTVVPQYFVLAAKIAGAKNFAFASCAENAACSVQVPILKQQTAMRGINYAATVKLASAAPNYTAECLELKQQNVDYVQVGTTGAVAVRFANDCAQQGFKPKFGIGDGAVFSGDFAGKDITLAGGLSGFPWWAKGEAVQQYRDATSGLEEKVWANDLATVTWIGLEMFRKAMADAPAKTTRDDVFSGLYGLKDDDLGGLAPQKLTFTKGQPAPEVKCFWLYSRSAPPEEEYKTLHGEGPAGNGQSGDFASTCLD